MSSYLSDATLLACQRSSTASYGGYWGDSAEESTASSLQAAVAGSVATRGILFANNHPAPRRCAGLA